MSVQSNQYLILGAKLDYDKYKSDDWLEKFEPYQDSAFDLETNPKGLHCLFDGMNGQYVIIGHCLVKTELYESIDYMEIQTPADELVKQIKDDLKAKLGIDKPLGLHLVTHYR